MGIVVLVLSDYDLHLLSTMLPDQKEIRYFLFSQYLADGIRITLGIILPVIITTQLGRMDLGMLMGMGALCVSITDIPGPVEHKQNGMLYCNAFIFGMAFLTGLVNHSILLTGLMIAASTFFFSMFNLYGNRAALVGSAALLAMILRLHDKLTLPDTLFQSLLVLAGGVWYMLLALLVYRLRPYRPAQRALGESIHELSKYLRIKAAMYNINTDFDEEYRKLLNLQVTINEKQDTIRELLFKDKELMKEPTKTGRLLVLTFADSIDLYEQVMATWYDYRSLRKQYAETGLLQDISLILTDMAGELDRIGLAIQSNSNYQQQYQLLPALEKLKHSIDLLENKGQQVLVLKKILVNLRNLGHQIDELSHYFSATISEKGKMRSVQEYARFVSHQEIDLTVFRNNFHLRSGIFRHSLRMMITCVVVFATTKLLAYGEHSYWVLLTTIVILKPGFSLTRQRNRERLLGTLAGGVVGVIVLSFIHDRDILFGIIIFFMVGTYTFQRYNYIWMVIFITPYILILFNLLGMGFLNVVQERIIDTTIASILAFLANYFLFPYWESQQLQQNIAAVLKSNIAYLDKLRTIFLGRPISLLEYKLVRKDMYISMANLSAAFQRMLSEPASKQKNEKDLYEFTVLNNVLSANIASLSANMKSGNTIAYTKEVTVQMNRSIANLQLALQTIEPSNSISVETPPPIGLSLIPVPPDRHLSEQLDFIVKVTRDIEKTAAKLH